MDLNKTGKFISEARKNKGMTQEQLAFKMGVSINAVSKWERGLSFPDVSLFKQLCMELDISLEELINGEKNTNNDAVENAIITTIKDNNKIKKKKNKIIYSLIIIFIFIVLGLFYYGRNKILNLVGEYDDLYDSAISYLYNLELKENPDAGKNDFNVFFSYHGFGIDENVGYTYIYMWIAKESYYVEDGNSLAISGGSSMAYKFTYKDNKIIEVENPLDGDMYTSSIKKMFPYFVSLQVLNYDSSKNINKLFNEINTNKNNYYNYLNLDMGSLTIKDIVYNNLLFSINVAGIYCIPVKLDIYTDGKYIYNNSYKSCKYGEYCSLSLKYISGVEGKYDYDVMEIIKHSIDANNIGFTSDNIPKYEIISGNGHMFVSDDNNKYLKDFLSKYNIDLEKCASAL